MLYTNTKTEYKQLTKADNFNTYTAHSDGLTVVSESSHTVAGPKAKGRKRADKGLRTSVQRAKDRSRWLDSLFNNYSDRGVDSLRCAFFTGHFSRETKSVQVAQNRVSRWIKDLPFDVESWTSVAEYDQFGLVHVHVILKAEPAVLNKGINYLHNTLIETFKAFGTGHSQRIYNLDQLGRYLMLSGASKATNVKQALQDEQQAKESYNTVKGLNVPAGIKQQAKKTWRKSHMDKKKAVAKAYEKHGDKIMKKSYGQNHGVKVRCCRVDVWAYIVEHGRYLGSTKTKISNDSHLINVVKRDFYRLNDTDTRELQRLLGAVKAYQDTVKAVA